MTQSQQVVEELHDCFTQTAANIISYFEGQEVKDKLKELRDVVQNHCMLDKQLKAIEDTKDRLLNLHGDDNTENNIETIIDEYKNAISEISAENDTSTNNRLVDFDKHVKALLGDNKDDEDTEMQVTGGYVNVIDPISKKRIVDPVSNTVCGHTYDKETIAQILKLNARTRCPVIGCKSNEFVQLKHLRTDIVTKAYLEKNPA